MIFRVLDDVIRQSQLFGDGKRITLARDADQETVGWAQGGNIKLAAGIFHARSAEGVDL